METDQDRYVDVLHNIRTGIRYHLRRQAFFERWHKITGVVSLVSSSAAVAVILQDVKIATFAAAVVAVAQAIDLMFETRKHADLHRDLRQRYNRLEPEVLGHSGLDAKAYQVFKEKIASVEVDEPPVRATLLSLSQNDAATVSGYSKDDNPETFTDLNWFQRHFPNIL